MTWYEKIIAAHTSVTDAVSHGQRLKSSRYFVWQEDGENSLLADGKHAETAVTGWTDLFTKREFDPWKDELSAALDAMPGVAWRLSYTDYEEDTGFWHYQWTWSVVSDG